MRDVNGFNHKDRIKILPFRLPSDRLANTQAGNNNCIELFQY